MVRSKDSTVLLTLNTHSYMEPDTEYCLAVLTEAIIREQVAVIALQEVNQTANAPAVDFGALAASGYVVSSGERPIRTDNYALLLAERLHAQGYAVHWTWVYAHYGYHRYEEGLAVMSVAPILDTCVACLSAGGAKGAVRNRRWTVGILCEADGPATWFYSTHMGWWDDKDDPFASQWTHLQHCALSGGEAPVYLLGDFNAPAGTKGEGYDLIVSSGYWQDCYQRAAQKDEGSTVLGRIDGWRKAPADRIRIDQVWTNRPGTTLRSRVIFDGAYYPMISDHLGVLTEEALP